MKILVEKSQNGQKILHIGSNSQIDFIKKIFEEYKKNEIIYEEEINGFLASYIEFNNEKN